MAVQIVVLRSLGCLLVDWILVIIFLNCKQSETIWLDCQHQNLRLNMRRFLSIIINLIIWISTAV